MLGHDHAHSGRSEYKAGANSGAVKWKFQPHGMERPLSTSPWWLSSGISSFSLPAIGPDGIIYVAGQEWNVGTHKYSSHLYAISSGGMQLWSLRTSGLLGTGGEASPAVGSDGTIYATGTENISDGLPKKVYVYAVGATGILLWQSEIKGKAVSSPTLGNSGLIYVGTADTYGNGHLYAIEPNGGIRWKVDTGDIAMSSPAIDNDGTIYVGSFGHIEVPEGGKPLPEMSSKALAEAAKTLEFDVYAFKSSGKLKWRSGPTALCHRLPRSAQTGQSTWLT